jgi:glyoxylase-like metal-dependent hydrolase (beta-lactamase superfamily II)
MREFQEREGVSARLGNDPRKHRLVQPCGQDGFQERPCIPTTQRLHLQLRESGPPTPYVASRERKRDPLRQQATGHELESAGRCVVEPLRVVDDTQQLLLSGRLREETESGEADEKWTWRRALANPERDTERVALGIWKRVKKTEDRLAKPLQSRVVERHLRLYAGGANNAKIAPRLDRELKQRGLPDPGVSLHHQDSAVTVSRRSEHAAEHGLLTLPADQSRHPRTSDHPGSMPSRPRTMAFMDSISARRSQDSAMAEEEFPEYAPIPRSALGPAVNEQGYHVDRIERNLYWVTDGTYQSAFMTTSDGVVLFDAPPTIGNNIKRAVDEIASANGVSNNISYLVYSHHHADHLGASSLFGKDVTRIGHEETRRLLLRDDDPARPPNEETFQDTRSLEIGGERIDLAWHGGNHSPDNIIIHLPDHDTLMMVDIVNPGWAPVYVSNLTEDIPGYLEAPGNALAYSWQHFIGGHVSRLGTRDDVQLHQQYMADIVESSKVAIDAVDPRRWYAHYGENKWAAAKGHLDETTRLAAAPVIEKYKDLLAGADIFTDSTAFWVMESIRLDQGYGSQVHP